MISTHSSELNLIGHIKLSISSDVILRFPFLEFLAFSVAKTNFLIIWDEVIETILALKEKNYPFVSLRRRSLSMTFIRR
ncbi:hypothetical protein PFJ87_11g00180 [Encephalitozoon hellem]|uniref:Uncharacterized protein n=1 Tax=Encephalitozoon hellem TaxID=27973 RepID=A0ABY8CLI4_ENCHE|nr:hypothetical protein PFJ87_11g00180 [Encephalitozoon hellem]